MRKNIIIFLLAITSCKEQIDLEYIKSKEWAYDEGFQFANVDFIRFDTQETLFSLKGDTILRNGKPCAIITALDKDNISMTLKSLDGKEKGEYWISQERMNGH